MWPWKEGKAAPAEAMTSVLDEGSELSGRLTFVGTLVLNGKFTGEIESSDTLLVGETGELEADVRVGVAVVSGQLKGSLTARERVILRSSARIVGDIVTPALVLEEGVVFDGRCKMKEEEPERRQVRKEDELRVVEQIPLRQHARG